MKKIIRDNITFWSALCVSFVGLFIAIRACDQSNESIQISREANRISEKANEISEQALKISKESMGISQSPMIKVEFVRLQNHLNAIRITNDGVKAVSDLGIKRIMRLLNLEGEQIGGSLHEGRNWKSQHTLSPRQSVTFEIPDSDLQNMFHSENLLPEPVSSLVSMTFYVTVKRQADRKEFTLQKILLVFRSTESKGKFVAFDPDEMDSPNFKRILKNVKALEEGKKTSD